MVAAPFIAAAIQRTKLPLTLHVCCETVVSNFVVYLICVFVLWEHEACMAAVGAASVLLRLHVAAHRRPHLTTQHELSQVVSPI